MRLAKSKQVAVIGKESGTSRDPSYRSFLVAYLPYQPIKILGFTLFPVFCIEMRHNMALNYFHNNDQTDHSL